MSTAQHTPGPWNVTRIAYDIARGIDSGVREVKAVRNGGYKRYIADVRSIDSQGIDNTEANAALIAAAPELLNTLRVLVREIEHIESMTMGPIENYVSLVRLMKQQAQVAITQAEGRT